MAATGHALGASAPSTSVSVMFDSTPGRGGSLLPPLLASLLLGERRTRVNDCRSVVWIGRCCWSRCTSMRTKRE